MKKKIRNVNNNTIIENVDYVSDIFSKIIGLMFKKRGKILMKFLFSKRYSIWMPFMKYSIDIAFIDKDKCIVDIKTNVLPISFNINTWKLYKSKKKCKYILEVENGVLERKLFKVGDSLDF
jgi:uncharacterized membrane protein (UPF0127 family)